EVMAQAYYRAGDLPKAIGMLERLNTVDPWSTPDPRLQQRNLLLVNLYLEHGDLAKSNSLSFFNKAIELDANYGASYYYRGLANLQLKKNADARADFQKVIAIAPGSS